MRRASTALVGIVLLLLAFGVVMLASTSTVKGDDNFGDPHHFVKRQVIWLILALAVGVIAAIFDYHWWYKLAVPLGVASIVLLVLVLIPGIGHRVARCYRWLRVGPLSFQPSELAKFTVVVLLASWIVRVGRKTERLLEGIILPGVVLAVFFGLILLEPDYGTALLIAIVGMCMLFVGGARIGYLVVTGVSGASLFMLAVFHSKVRMARVLAYCMPEKFPGPAYQSLQSKLAFIMGGWSGVGLGESMQKRFYLPEAHTDFIFAIVGEELGIAATLAVLIMFAAILVIGLVISSRAPDPLGRLLGFGLTMMLVSQAAINIGVVTGCLPTKGLPLPFISYGGSSLLISVMAIGVLVNIARHSSGEVKDHHTRAIRDLAHSL